MLVQERGQSWKIEGRIFNKDPDDGKQPIGTWTGKE